MTKSHLIITHATSTGKILVTMDILHRRTRKSYKQVYTVFQIGANQINYNMSRAVAAPDKQHFL